jgi:hypothetical protein
MDWLSGILGGNCCPTTGNQEVKGIKGSGVIFDILTGIG